jgi:hypothetical protein
MKILTVNFLTCAVKSCKTSALAFPLHFRDAELVRQDMDFQPDFVRNVLGRVDWDGLRVTAGEVSVLFFKIFFGGEGEGLIVWYGYLVGIYDVAGGEAGGGGAG